METTESPQMIKEMHNALRDLLGFAFKQAQDVELQYMMNRMYEATKSPLVAISATKGFPYITYNRDVADPYANRVLTRCGRWYSGTVDPGAGAPMVGRLIDTLTAAATTKGYTVPVDTEARVLRGEEIHHAYEKMAGCHSCMTEGEAWRTMLYCLNPDVIGLAVMGPNKARALLWKTIEGHTVLDRIYPGSGFMAALLRSWALDQGYLVRNSNAASTNELFVDKKNKTYGNLHVQLSKFHPQHIMPYLDTFAYVSLPPPNGKMQMSMRRETGFIATSEVPQQAYELVGPHYGVLPDWLTVNRKPKRELTE